ncbi:hypothetical protein PHISCL_05391 [Aspergillus sclerotialis]|uniref:rRNA biogenesis protein RRP36 n=1 Tax=Aspergillus sclerotialis TaxID=2070753 RepID=A0A3A2ZIX3_9EURO|nr:hypothetical protein PHISCL_05391 [Aspergillus sclerotialis]
MAISDLLNRRVRPQPDDDDAYSEQSGSDEVSDHADSIKDDSDASDASDNSLDESDDASNAPSEVDKGGSDESDGDDDEDDDDEASNSDQPQDDFQDSLNNISFGALAKAQASMGPKKKRKVESSNVTDPTPTTSPLDTIRAQIREAREKKRLESAKSKNPEKLSRTSKHAPTVQSSKRAVSRKRTVIEPPAVPKARDPRFDATVLSNSSRAHPNAGNAYSFLDEYRKSELKELKEKLAKTKDPEQKEALKRAVRSAGDRLRSIENKKREQEVMAEHKRKEKQLIREGKKSTPYYLKKSDLKNQALVKKYEGMGSRERAKALERRRKKIASKERKDMPMERRGAGDASNSNDGGRKRRRVA